MANEIFVRYENKFVIDQGAYEGLWRDLAEFMEADGYGGPHEFYTVSNIYYDTRDSSMIRNSLSKPEYKEKLRLRAYGVPDADSRVFLEIKKKYCGLVSKRRTALLLSEAYSFLDTGIKPDLRPYMNKQVLNEIDYVLRLYNPEPKVFLAYERKALVGRENRGLRITFDTNIRTRRNNLRFEHGDRGEFLLENGTWLMEIKAEKNIPFWLSKLLSRHKAYSTSFSKYGREYRNQLTESRLLRGRKEDV